MATLQELDFYYDGGGRDRLQIGDDPPTSLCNAGATYGAGVAAGMTGPGQQATQRMLLELHSMMHAMRSDLDQIKLAISSQDRIKHTMGQD